MHNGVNRQISLEHGCITSRVHNRANRAGITRTWVHSRANEAGITITRVRNRANKAGNQLNTGVNSRDNVAGNQ